MLRPLKAGFIGTGFIGSVHARAALQAGARLAGVVSSTPERSQAAAQALGAARAYASAEDLIDDDGVDVVHICTPNHLHAPLAVRALAAGKHVICEKPLALTSAEAAGLVEAANSSGRIATVPFVYRYYPLVREARERLHSGKAGRLRLMHGSYLQDWLLREDDDNWRVDAALGGASRAFADIGSHWCDLAQFISQQSIVRVSARKLIAVPRRHRGDGASSFTGAATAGGTSLVDTEDAVLVHFETAEGVLGSVTVSQVSPGRKNRLWIELDASDESLVFNQEEPETLWCGRRESATVLRRDPAQLTAAGGRMATLPAGHPEGYASCFEAFVGDTYAAIHTGEVPEGLPTFADGLAAASITDAVLASADSGQWIDVDRHIN
ncbi:Gfo/Idh/MocA family protein [Streptomyces cylindrosporus]|uniref:Gfo/Idh/MocA family oxidoreductase n=1 Tax=Streptomyces cylindrosporus TaxID=2927583 RepID=A0ABS9Y165_9ACTN|nr:Gfo/Idh/MocA family oxidoreductase [Streptomyces cylindrosporus]MCI3270764.1 Gfo/Idh/MocA family oxidoreductase [Streptomyces cylindrosporus]